MKISIRLTKRGKVLIGLLCWGLILPASLSAEKKEFNSYFVEMKSSSPVNYKDYGSYRQQLVSGSIVKVYLVEYQYFNASYRVVGMDIKTADDDIYYIHLAPPHLFIEHGLGLSQGENVTVRGAVMNIDQRQVFVASKVFYEGQNIRLRTDQGIPTWGAVSQFGRSPIFKLKN